MAENPNPETRQTQSLLTNLVILSIVILGLIVLVSAYPAVLAPEPTLTPTLTLTLRPTRPPSLTPTPPPTSRPTNTLRPTLTPSITPSPVPSLTPTITASPPGPPTLTPARPVPGNELYNLNQWGPERADGLIELMENYPNTLDAKARGEDNTAYYQAYSYAVFALQEALLRFPEAPQAGEWQWSLAYHLAQMGDPGAGESYANLVVQALNRGEVSPAELRDWFPTQEPRLRLFAAELDPPSGYLSSYLVQIEGHGGAFIWLLQDQGAFVAYPLASQFDFTRQAEARSIISDLTGDEQVEVAVYTSQPLGGAAENFPLQPPQVFDLSQPPARQLPFAPAGVQFEIGMEYDNRWAVTPQAGSPTPALLFRGRAFPACPATLERTYVWDGEFFRLVGTSARLEILPSTLALCGRLVDHAIQAWGPPAAAQLMEQLLPEWPPALDEAGQPYPADARDEWRFRLGMYQALAGDSQAALTTLQSLVREPAVPNSRWLQPTHNFLDTYQGPDDIYRACPGVPYCRPAGALRRLVETTPPGSDPVERLWQGGVPVIASGYFDFDLDGERERWLTTRHQPLERPELWVLAATRDGWAPLFAGFIDNSKPDLLYLDEDEQPPVVQYDPEHALLLHREPGTFAPYLEQVVPQIEIRNPYRDGLQAAEQALFSGADPAQVYKDLLALQENPGLMCAPYWTCDPYYYLLGLAGEMAGQPRDAIDAYLRLWWDYSRSPYTTMARLKLAGRAVPPSATPTPGPTATLTQTPVPTVTGTPPTPTFTPTITFTPTATTGTYP